MRAEYDSRILPYDMGEVTYNYRVSVRLREAIDPLVLDNAVQKASARYPYLKRKLVLKREELLIVENRLSLVVYDLLGDIRDLNQVHLLMLHLRCQFTDLN